jgi:hypothetical protein
MHVSLAVTHCSTTFNTGSSNPPYTHAHACPPLTSLPVETFPDAPKREDDSLRELPALVAGQRNALVAPCSCTGRTAPLRHTQTQDAAARKHAAACTGQNLTVLRPPPSTQPEPMAIGCSSQLDPKFLLAKCCSAALLQRPQAHLLLCSQPTATATSCYAPPSGCCMTVATGMLLATCHAWYGCRCMAATAAAADACHSCSATAAAACTASATWCRCMGATAACLRCQSGMPRVFHACVLAAAWQLRRTLPTAARARWAGRNCIAATAAHALPACCSGPVAPAACMRCRSSTARPCVAAAPSPASRTSSPRAGTAVPACMKDAIPKPPMPRTRCAEAQDWMLARPYLGHAIINTCQQALHQILPGMTPKNTTRLVSRPIKSALHEHSSNSPNQMYLKYHPPEVPKRQHTGQ